jgi:hypothetical protein
LGRLRDKRSWGREVARKYLDELGEN